MADNVTLPGTGLAVASDDIGGVQHQLVKVAFGVDGAATRVSAASPLPVTNGQSQPVTDAQLRAAAVPVSAANLPLPTGAATDLGLANIFARLADGSVVALVSGSVAVSNFPASQAVTGTFWQATQPVSIAATVAVSGPLTDTQLRATAVPVSAASLPLPTGAATETTVAGVRTDLGTDGSAPPAVLGSGTGVRGWLRSIYEKLTGSIAVTGTFFQATQPVSIAATVVVSGPLTDTQLRASAVPVSLATLPALTTGSATIGAVTGPAAAPLALDASLTGHAQTFKALTAVTALSTANTGVTATLPAVAAQFHYITRIRITNINPTATAIAGSAVTLAYTSTNLPGSLAWTAGNALAAGAEKVVVDEVLSQPLKSSTVNTASTIVAPAIGAGGLCRITVYYYTAP